MDSPFIITERRDSLEIIRLNRPEKSNATLVEGLALEAQLFSSLFATNDMREGTRAFLEKQPPVFKGS
ncbi:MAG: enoyl-CoA hydratase-related protein [Pyrinomonadaceae bacterium]